MASLTNNSVAVIVIPEISQIWYLQCAHYILFMRIFSEIFHDTPPPTFLQLLLSLLMWLLDDAQPSSDLFILPTFQLDLEEQMNEDNFSQASFFTEGNT